MKQEYRNKQEDGSRKPEDEKWKMENGSRKTRDFGLYTKKIAMKFKFENLIIWQKAMELGEEVNKLSNKFPKKEMYNLSSQIRRAADSIALNISEGSIGQSDLEFRRFMGYAIRSLAEVVTCIHKAKRREYISEQEYNKYYSDSFNLMNMMVAFKKKLTRYRVGLLSL
ncbi:unnamed protein product, partial [marine sediment metagenome]